MKATVPLPTDTDTDTDTKTNIPRRRSFFFWLPSALKIFFVCVVVLVLIAILLPIGNSTCVKGSQTRAFAQAKQIGLALKLYAGDHDGIYPAGVNIYGENIRTSNDAFRNLFPTYAQSETLFGNKLSAYQVTQPDNVISPPREILRAGENVYSYIAGVTEKMPETTPLVADGTDGTGLGLYVSDPLARGGVWKGARAIVIHLDNSGSLDKLAGPDNTRYIPRIAADGKKWNLLGPATLEPGTKLLDPAVVPPETR